MKRLQDKLGTGLHRLALITVVCLVLVPVILAVMLSFDNRTYIGPLPPTEWTLRWYHSFFTSDQYLQGLKWSVLVAIVAVAASTITGVMAALYLHNSSFRGRDLLLSFFLSPLLIPHVVIGFGILMAFSKYGVHDTFVRLVAAHMVLTMPFTIRMTLVGLQGLNKSFGEAAMTLGARPMAIFWQVTFPLIRPGIVASVVFATAVSMGEASSSAFLVDGDIRTLPLALLSEMRNNLDLTVAAVSGFLVATTALVVLLLDVTVGLDRITGRGVYSRD